MLSVPLTTIFIGDHDGVTLSQRVVLQEDVGHLSLSAEVFSCALTDGDHARVPPNLIREEVHFLVEFVLQFAELLHGELRSVPLLLILQIDRRERVELVDDDVGSGAQNILIKNIIGDVIVAFLQGDQLLVDHVLSH